MRRFLGHILATLLAASLSGTVLLWTLGATLASPTFLEHTADQTQLYPQLASAAPGTDAATIRTAVQSTLPQLIDYVLNGGPGATLDIPGVTDGPVTLSQANPQLTAAGHGLRQAANYLPVAVAVLALLIIAVMGHLRWHTLARAVLGSAIGLGVSAAIMWLAPGFISQNSLKSLPDQVKTGLAQFITDVLHAVALHLAVAALVMLAVAALLGAVHLIGRLRAKFARAPKPPSAPLPPAGNTSRF